MEARALWRAAPKAVRAGVKRINGRTLPLSKFAVQWEPWRDILPRVFLATKCGRYGVVVGSSSPCAGDFCNEVGGGR